MEIYGFATRLGATIYFVSTQRGLPRERESFFSSAINLMDAFDIVRLVAACVALVLGAIVFLVLFFRAIAWVDRWLKRSGSATVRRKKQVRSPGSNSRTVLDVPIRKIPVQKTSARSKRSLSASNHLMKTDVEPSMVRTLQRAVEPTAKKAAASIHLQCGQIVEPVYLVQSMEALKICEGLGLRGDGSVVGYGKQGEILIIREGNIKMITIQSDAASSIQLDIQEHVNIG